MVKKCNSTSHKPYCPKCFLEVGGVFEKAKPYDPEALATFAVEVLGENPEGAFVQFIRRKRRNREEREAGWFGLNGASLWVYP